MSVLRELPQLVPSRTCLQCEVCCRFPDPDSALRPYFTKHEITQALAGGLPAEAFPNQSGSQVRLVPAVQGEGYLCPAFNPDGTCRIYAQRPMDCQLYPLALMWNAPHDQVVLGWDAKCPFMREMIPEAIQHHATRVLALLADPSFYTQVVDHPRLIGGFQVDIVVLTSLPRLTKSVVAQWGSAPLHRLALNDLPLLARAVAQSGFDRTHILAAYAPVYHYIWEGLLAYWWVALHERMCLFAHSPDGWFLALPPVGEGALEPSLSASMALLRRWNGDSLVTRVENVPAQLVSAFTELGYRLTPKEPDYLYQARTLATLAGEQYKSHRALCNRFEREQTSVVSCYQDGDRLDCRRLYEKWSRQKYGDGLEALGLLLLSDAASAHEIIWSQASVLQVTGMVIRIQGRLCAYTFGYWLAPTTFCVLIEVSDRTVSGLAQYLFRETCRTALATGAEYINTMDDAGLVGLRASKQAYHPAQLIANFVAAPLD